MQSKRRYYFSLYYQKQIEDETKDTRDTYRRLNDAVNQLDI